MSYQTEVVPAADIARFILSVRDERVIFDSDLARIYGVETRSLNQAVKRNENRFPEDFMFQLTDDEAEEALRLRSQIVILKPGRSAVPHPEKAEVIRQKAKPRLRITINTRTSFPGVVPTVFLPSAF